MIHFLLPRTSAVNKLFISFVHFSNLFIFVFSRFIRENELGANLIVEMEGKKTRLLKPSKQPSTLTQQLREHHHDFTFDYSYWSLDDSDGNFANQEEVFNDLGTDVVDCAFQGYNACVFAYGV